MKHPRQKLQTKTKKPKPIERGKSQTRQSASFWEFENFIKERLRAVGIIE